MTGVTNAELAAALQQVIAQVDAREDQLKAWQSGAADGGPYADGRFPIVNLLGDIGYFKSPARLDYEVGLLTSSADGALAQCLAAQAEAQAAATLSETKANAAGTHAATATTKAQEADTFRQQAANSEANALVYRNQAATSATTATGAAAVAEDAAGVAVIAKDDAVTARNAAQAAAAAAATFNPNDFYTKVVSDSRFLNQSNFTWANLAGKPSTFTPSAHGHIIADISGLQTALDGKQAAGSYVTTAGFTWSALAGKPTTFTPSAHTHVISEITGLQTALDGKQPVGNYSLVGHGHVIADISGLQTALDGKQAAGSYVTTTNFTWANLSGKPSTFTPSAHTHVISDVTGLQTALDGKQAAGNYSLVGHGHVISDISGLQTALDGKQAAGSYVTTSNFTWANLSGKPSTFTPSAHTHVISDVTGLQTALDGKQAAGNYSLVGHGHVISDISGLQTALDGKASVGHTHAYLPLTGGTVSGNLVASAVEVRHSSADTWTTRMASPWEHPAHIYNQNTAGFAAIAYHVGNKYANLLGYDENNVLKTNNSIIWHSGNFNPDAKADQVHAHSISHISGLQSALDGKQAIGNYSLVGHTHDYLPLSGGTISGLLFANGSIWTTRIGYNPNEDVFPVGGTTAAQYGMSLGEHNGNGAGFCTMLSGYSGLRLATGGVTRLTIDTSGTVSIPGTVVSPQINLGDSSKFIRGGAAGQTILGVGDVNQAYVQVGNSYYSIWNAGNFDPNSKANASHTHAYLPLTGGTLTGNLSAVDMFASRGDTTGVIYLGNQSGGARYLYYDGFNYYLNGAGLHVSGDLTINGGSPVYRSSWTNDFQSSSDFVNGTLVETDIPANVQDGESFEIEITGKSYNASNPPYKVIAQGYLYNNTIISASGISYGGQFADNIKVMERNGVLCFWWPRISYWNSFRVSVVASMYPSNGTLARNRVTAITDIAEPSSSKKVTISLHRSIQTAPGGAANIQRPYSLLLNLFNDGGLGSRLQFADLNWSANILHNSGNLMFQTQGENTRMFIGNGVVGIGTTNPLAHLVVSNGGGENIEFTPGGSTLNGGVIEYINRTNGLRPDLNYYLGTGGAHKFYTSGFERMRVASNGNVAINTTDADSTFRVQSHTNSGLRIGFNNTAQNYYDGDNHYFRSSNGTNLLTADINVVFAYKDLYALSGNLYIRENPAGAGAGMRLHHNGGSAYIDFDGDLHFRTGDGNGLATLSSAGVFSAGYLYSMNTVRSGISSGTGFIQMDAGNGSYPGYLSWYTPDGTRRGYMGWAEGTNIVYQAEAGWGFKFNSKVELGGTTFNASSNVNTHGAVNQFLSYGNPQSDSGPSLQAYAANSSSGAWMSFHRPNLYAINMGLDSNNVFRIGGWSAWPDLFSLTMSGNMNILGGLTTNGTSWLYGQTNSSYQIRATGWWNSNGGSATGLGVEIGATSGNGYVYSYNRDAATYGPLRLGGSIIVAENAARFDSTASFMNTVDVYSGNLRINSGGGDSTMGAYISYRNNLGAERGWLGYGEGTSRMRVYNGIGDILVQGNRAQIDSWGGLNARISTTSGYLDVGPLNSSWCHFATDRPNFYFSQPVHFDGAPMRYNQGAVLHHGSSSLGSGVITVSTASPSGGSDGDIWIKVAS